jgi:hypothetical protein
VGANEVPLELDEPLLPMFGQSCFARGAVAPGVVVVPAVVVDGVVEPPAAHAAPAPTAATAAKAATSVRTRIIGTSLSVPIEETART